jgi:hypothetical protein
MAFEQAMVRRMGDRTEMTDFGTLHAVQYDRLPIFFGEVRAARG